MDFDANLDPSLTSRRAVLRLGAGLCAWACAGCGGAAPTKEPDTAADPADAGPADGQDPAQTDEVCPPAPDALDSRWVAVPLAAYPALAAVGGGVAIDLNGRRLVVAQPSAGCFAAVDRACTHQGCDVAFAEGRFLCPCHGAAFDVDGAVLSGPTIVPLGSYPAALRGELVWVRVG